MRAEAPTLAAHPSAAAALRTLAFHGLVPVSPAYATLPILEGFNWAAQLAGAAGGPWYLVVFRSVRRADADEALLTLHDERAYQEALGSRGLLHYFRGLPDADGACLSFCVWENQAAAQRAGRQPEHQTAARLVGAMYHSYHLERYLLRLDDRGLPAAEPLAAPPRWP